LPRTIAAPSSEGIMATRQPLPSLAPLTEDRRSNRLWILLLVFGLFMTVVSWLDWMF
jgi:hypothetical protein